MRRMDLLLMCLVILTACAALTVGREFPAPAKDTIRNGVTTKAELVRLFGEPTQVGIDDGDTTWTWVYFKHGDPQLTKQLQVRFTDRGVAKSYSYSSNFPEDMRTLK